MQEETGLPYPFSDMTQMYLAFQMPHMREFAGRFDIVYVLPLKMHSEEAACAIYAALKREGREVALSVYNRRAPYIQVVPDRERKHPANAGIIAVDHERTEKLLTALSNPRLKERYGITSVFYTWVYPQGNHEIIEIPSADEISPDPSDPEGEQEKARIA